MSYSISLVQGFSLIGLALLGTTGSPAVADTLLMKDGTELRGVYVRDEGIRLLVWEKLADVGGPSRVVPRSQVKSYKVERGEDWDVQPALPDLSVTFIELNPKLAGLHGRVDYDSLGRPVLKGGPLPDLGERAAKEPEELVRGLKLAYTPGEEVTLTAHVKNLGFRTARPFRYTWLIDGSPVKSGQVTRSLKEMEETSQVLKWNWQDGEHTVTFRIDTGQPEIATINNEVTDPLWGWAFYYIVHPGRAAAWHQKRTAFGTFSFEDFYRWHVDIMNTLFAASIYPSAPNGIRARVRLDRIVYAEDVEAAQRAMSGPNGLGFHQGGWTWLDDEDRKKEWKPASHEWRNQTEWSLPHELGHQLGLVDYYALDYAGTDDHVWPDNGEKVTHFQNHPETMMHWHGPHVYSELDAGYLNQTWNKPRGHFGDYYFAIPLRNNLRFVDVNGCGVAGAVVNIFQRGVEVAADGQPGEDRGSHYFPVVEDGNFDRMVSVKPVITGTTDPDGILRLPNRPVAEVRTLNGYERKPNPFGNINVVGNRGLMLAKVTKDDRTAYYWLEITDFVTAWQRGQKEQFTMTLKTPFGSIDSPQPSRDVRVISIDEKQAKIGWNTPAVPRETVYLDKAIGFRVYRRIAGDGLNDRPWFPVATLGPEAREVTVDLTQYPADTYWFSKTNRFAVTALGELGVESELVEIVAPTP